MANFQEYGDKVVLENNLTVCGDLKVCDNLTADNISADDVTIIDLTLTNLTVNNNTILQGPTTINNNLNVTNLTVNNNTILQGPTTINNNLTQVGNYTTTGVINAQSDVQVNGSSVISNVTNLGDRDIFASKVGNNINLRGLTNTDGRVSLTQGATDITIGIPQSLFPSSFSWAGPPVNTVYNPNPQAIAMPNIVSGSSPELHNPELQFGRWIKIGGVVAVELFFIVDIDNVAAQTGLQVLIDLANFQKSPPGAFETTLVGSAPGLPITSGTGIFFGNVGGHVSTRNITMDFNYVRPNNPGVDYIVDLHVTREAGAAANNEPYIASFWYNTLE